MDIMSGNLPSMVFRYMAPDKDMTYTLNSLDIGVFMHIDGSKSVGEIADQTGLDMGAMRSVIDRLIDLKLIQADEEAMSVLDNDFLYFLNSELSLAIGPIAEVLIEDAVHDLGHDMYKFPSHRATELVNLLSGEIQREEKKLIFKQNMSNKIMEKKY